MEEAEEETITFANHKRRLMEKKFISGAESLTASEPDDQKMMETPRHWPKWPFLPLKRFTNGRMESAVLYATAQDGKPVVFVKVNLFGIKDEVASKPISEWPGYREVTPAEIVAEGWVVD